MKTFCCICRETKDNSCWTRITLKDARGVTHGLCKGCYDKAINSIMEEYGSRCLPLNAALNNVSAENKPTGLSA